MIVSTVYGYIRVSTKDQNEARQLTAMRAFGVEEENIVIEKQSGKDFKRPLYLALTGRLGPEDVLVIKSIDRLGGTIRRFWTSGRVSQRSGGPRLWCWTCRCWTPGRAGT